MGKLGHPRTWPSAAAVICTFADYFGLAMVTPALPFYLSEIGVAEDDIPSWNGAITTAQFAAIVVGNLASGRFGDRFGSKAALQVAMAGDAVFFALSAFAPFGVKDAQLAPILVLLARLGAGLCTPLVSAILYIFDRAATRDAIVRGMGTYTLSITCAFAAGGVLVGFTYDAIGWRWLNLASALLAAAACAYVSLLSAPPLQAGRKPRPEGLLAAVRTLDFATHGWTAFVVGWSMNTHLLLSVLLLKQSFGFAPNQVGFVFLGVPCAIFPAQYLIPRATRRWGIHRCITLGTLGNAACCGLLALPAVHARHVAPLIACFCGGIFCSIATQNPNLARAKLIAERHAKNATGAVTGVSRNCFASGQALAPLASGVLFLWSKSAPYLVLAGLLLSQLLLTAATRQPMWSDPPDGLVGSAPPPGSGGKAATAGDAQLEAGTRVAPPNLADVPRSVGSVANIEYGMKHSPQEASA